MESTWNIGGRKSSKWVRSQPKHIPCGIRGQGKDLDIRGGGKVLEELLIIQEEMWRVIVYQKWKAGWWWEHSSLQDHGDVTILSGISGYAYKQEAICLWIAEKCVVEWLPHLKARGVIPGWASEYEHLVEEGLAFDNSTDGIESPEKVQLNAALDAIFLYQILGIAHKADVSTPGSAHHPNLSHMLYGCWGYWGYILY